MSFFFHVLIRSQRKPEKSAAFWQYRSRQTCSLSIPSSQSPSSFYLTSSSVHLSNSSFVPIRFSHQGWGKGWSCWSARSGDCLLIRYFVISSSLDITDLQSIFIPADHVLLSWFSAPHTRLRDSESLCFNRFRRQKKEANLNSQGLNLPSFS